LQGSYFQTTEKNKKKISKNKFLKISKVNEDILVKMKSKNLEMILLTL